MEGSYKLTDGKLVVDFARDGASDCSKVVVRRAVLDEPDWCVPGNLATIAIKADPGDSELPSRPRRPPPVKTGSPQDECGL